MSETVAITPMVDAEERQNPVVYFIDDSATMREVIKIAFRRESIQVITCADAASALGQFSEHPPDVVITDVIMPDQDGYSVCSQIKQNPQFSKTPVILMSGVVNKNVADRAVAVKADELVRKPFQPQELIGRVKTLLGHKKPATTSPMHSTAGNSLSSLFTPAAPAVTPRPAPVPVPTPVAPVAAAADSVWPRALAEAFSPAPASSGVSNPVAPASQRPSNPASDTHRLRVEISHLELLIKKLQTELQIEKQYNQALELQIRALTQIE